MFLRAVKRNGQKRTHPHKRRPRLLEHWVQVPVKPETKMPFNSYRRVKKELTTHENRGNRGGREVSHFGGHDRGQWRAAQRRFLLLCCAMRAFTSFLTSATGSGWSVGKRMVPFDVEKALRSSLKASMTEAVGNKLQWSENAANHTTAPLYLKAGIR